MATPPQPIDLATAIADLTPIDWAALEAQAVQPADRAVLSRLRLLDRVVRACAEVSADGSQERSADVSSSLTTWGPFTLHERVGRGTFGEVYRAHDRRLDRIVALKLLRPGRDAEGSTESGIIKEGQLLAKVRHPNVVTVYGAERIDGRVGVWMEFIDGRTLESELRNSGPLSADAAITIGLALCDALQAVHRAGLLHRDLKAQNVIRASDGRIMLADFGTGGALFDPPSPQGGLELAGTPLYLPPEVLLDGGPASVSSEIYGLGVLLYHLTTGSFPVIGRTLRELRDAHAAGRRVSIHSHRKALSGPLMAVIERASAGDVSKRFRSLDDVASALRRSRSRSRRAARASLLVAATIVTGVAATAIWRGLDPPILQVGHTTTVPRPPAMIGATLLFASEDRIYYWTDDGAVVSKTFGGNEPWTQEINPPSPFEPIDFDRNHGEFLALGAVSQGEGEGERELWAGPTIQPTRRIGSVRCSWAAWSPDGRRIACATGAALYVVNRDGTELRELPTPTPAQIGGPHWSPDGALIRFTASVPIRDEVRRAIWEVSPDSGGLRQFLPGWNSPPQEYFGAWTPDGEFYIFGSTRDGRSHLWALREKRKIFDWFVQEPTQLTAGLIQIYSRPVLSSDGHTLFAVGIERRGELVRYDESRHVFEPYLGGLSATWPAVSPDGKAIAYTSFPDETLWLGSPDGVPQREIAGLSNVGGSMWSPDGKWISCIGRFQGSQRKIFLVSASGTESPRPITNDDRAQGIPSWSPIGSRFVFGNVARVHGVPDGDEVLHIYDVDKNSVSDVPESKGLWTARWSPDDRSLAAVAVDTMTLQIFDLRTQKWRPLPDAQHVNNPSWSGDSQWIYYDTEGIKPGVLRRVRVLDGHVETLTTLLNVSAATMWSGLTSDNSPLILRDVGTTELLALKLARR